MNTETWPRKRLSYTTRQLFRLRSEISTASRAKRNWITGSMEDVLLDGSVNRGYKGGNWNPPLSSVPVIAATIPHNAEKLTSYEMGEKTTLAGGKIRLNADVFYYDYEGISSVLPSVGGYRRYSIEMPIFMAASWNRGRARAWIDRATRVRGATHYCSGRSTSLG